MKTKASEYAGTALILVAVPIAGIIMSVIWFSQRAKREIAVMRRNEWGYPQ